MNNTREHTDIRKIYLQRTEDYQNQLAHAHRQSRGLSSLRLISFLGGAGALSYGYYRTMPAMYFLAFILFVLFFHLIVRHSRLNDKISFLENLVQINETAVVRLDGNWTTFTDDGSQYVNHNHPYTTDLHIFGKSSLFQFIYVPLSSGGKKRLVEMLSSRPSFTEIAPRQEAVADLAQRLDFRQHLQATASDAYFKKKNPAEVLSWLERKYGTGSVPQAVFFLPVVTLVMFALAFLGFVPYILPLGSLMLQALIALWGERVVLERFKDLEKPVILLRRYAELLAWIEGEEFKASFLKEQKLRLFTGDVSSSRLIKRLKSIAERNDLRFSNALIYYPLNISLFWDLWTLRKLQVWQDKWGNSVREWFDAVAEIEAISCLSGLYHDNPQWIFPKVMDGTPFIDGQNIAHPLISPDERVGNDLATPEQGRVLMITGSNMSGKSTLLRTLGINLVLAYTGSAVCATEMSCSMMDIYCKMQIHDDLKERTSTFYAELKRMKMIIDAAKSKEPLLVLLDEIFRGTNSRDRITATRTVIRQLHELNTITLVTTHDLELGSLADEYPGTISNYHFTDDIKADHIEFDYKIKPGISKTANAIALMKMIGIEEQQDNRVKITTDYKK
ncbi:MutS-related protein [Dethiobacter alkaliphilus]|uniref:MutS-related protein n=1 Tax=Dethiobacter alkaliphilus TaxID=427926 RepID=UPI002226DAF8|nr:DNA mismatch repair protein MutS [Dethiobacter alkaliphilus]MCW3489712.1 DNA mismatch repair protein MutS [Dethiobacter alkaliphilus]